MLTSGSKLGAYEVVAQIGAGGMGEVYSARDTRLNRNVALKVLPEVFAADPDCMARFGCEAKLLAPQISLPPVVDFPENSLSKWIKNTAGPLMT